MSPDGGVRDGVDSCHGDQVLVSGPHHEPLTSFNIFTAFLLTSDNERTLTFALNYLIIKITVQQSKV